MLSFGRRPLVWTVHEAQRDYHRFGPCPPFYTHSTRTVTASVSPGIASKGWNEQGTEALLGQRQSCACGAICAYLDLPIGSATVSSFSDGEIRIRVEENVRGADVFVVQSCCTPVNDSIMEMLIMIDALKRSSANRITAVIPYFGYARQDRKDQPRVPISAKLVADIITTAGADRVLTMDLHASQIQGFFNIPVDNLYALPVLMDYITKRKIADLVVVSPDAGGVERARAFAKRLQVNLAIIDKRREGPNQAQVMNIIGDVQGKSALLLDDMIDTARHDCAGRAGLHGKGRARGVGRLQSWRVVGSGLGTASAVLSGGGARDRFNSVAGERAEMSEVQGAVGGSSVRRSHPAHP